VSRWWAGDIGAHAEQSLFCLPYAGGGPQTYQRWGELLGSPTAVLAVTPPGRGRRFAEPNCRDLQCLVACLAEAIAAADAGPFVLFGHSLGALVAFELCRELRRRELTMPRKLIVSGRQAPVLPWTRQPISGLPTAEFIEALRDLGGTPEEVLSRPELMEILIPSLRADFAMVESYAQRDEAPLELPILALAGTRDPHAEARLMAGWASETTGAFSLQQIAGDHFFIDRQAAVVTARIADFLR
jgi:surfactin synthase thioesterase subunit